MEMTECLQNCRFYGTMNLKHSSGVKQELIEKYKTFLLRTYVEKISYLEVAPPGHTIAYKNVDNLIFKNDKYIL